MKKLLFTLTLVLSGVFAMAQTPFEKTMTEKIAKIDQTKTTNEFVALSNDFVRIGDKEKTQWLPYYYASLTQIMKGRSLMMSGKLDALDAIAAEAQKFLDKSSELNPENAENYILQKMIHGLKMMVDPMSRFMTEGASAQTALAKAEQLDPQNPRISILKAEDLYYTPAQFGGSKEKGLELFQKALDQFNTYKTKSNIDPNWGKSEAEYFLSAKP